MYYATGNRIYKKVTSAGQEKYTYYIKDAQGNSMALYIRTDAGVVEWGEQHLYGSSRLGVHRFDMPVPAGAPLPAAGATMEGMFEYGRSQYELSNHLGNVLVTVSDKKLQHSTNGTIVDYYNADVITANDYYPFGQTMPGRKYSQANTTYRYGFNGQMKSEEIGETYTAEFWEYDPRIGRRWNRDIMDKPWISDYAVLGNNPIYFIDPNGADWYKNDKTGKTEWFKGHRKHKGYTWFGDKNYVFQGSTLETVTVTAKAKQKTYEQLVNSKPQVALAVSGAYSTALSLYTGRYNTYGSVSSDVMKNLTEGQKQNDFKTNSPKTTGILIYEYLTGTGPEHRSFDETNPITEEIMYSESSGLAIWAMVNDFQNGKYKDGDTRSYYAAMAPDGGIGKAESIRRHMNAMMTTPASFYRGGMTYTMTKSGSNIIVKVTDAYTVMSMIRVNAKINRIPGQVTPLGKTTVEFNFIWRDVNFAAKEKR